MALFDTQLELITESDLQFLIENEVREGYQIEYKLAVLRDGKEKQDKIDFLASVTSFANTFGGDLLIGVEALSGMPIGIAGWQGADLDKEKLRIENLLRDLVEPRIAFTIHEILCSKGNVVMIRVPWSWAQPHMLKIDQLNRFTHPAHRCLDYSGRLAGNRHHRAVMVRIHRPIEKTHSLSTHCGHNRLDPLGVCTL